VLFYRVLNLILYKKKEKERGRQWADQRDKFNLSLRKRYGSLGDSS
jgi:hypothetical protein